MSNPFAPILQWAMRQLGCSVSRWTASFAQLLAAGGKEESNEQNWMVHGVSEYCRAVALRMTCSPEARIASVLGLNRQSRAKKLSESDGCSGVSGERDGKGAEPA